LPLFADVAVDKVDMDLLVAANEFSPFGSVVLARDAEVLAVFSETVGWPGAAEYRIALGLMVSSANAVDEFLAGRVAGSEPPSYSDLVS
jgi:hypothetical protein